MGFDRTQGEQVLQKGVKQMVCLCKTKLPEGARFCPECGRQVPARREPVEETEERVVKQLDPLLKPAEAARVLKISRWMLDELRTRGVLPRECYMEIPGSGKRKIIRYHTKELLTWKGQVDLSTAG